MPNLLPNSDHPDVVSDTRTRLILAAMELFAEHGVEGASLRGINELADCKNSGAVHYHFGKREQLVGAILDFILQQWGDAAAPPAEGETVRSLVQAIALSLLDLKHDHPWGSKALRFLARLMMEQNPDLQLLWRIHFGERLEPLATRIVQLCPQISAPTLRLRFMFAIVALVHAAAEIDALYRTALGDVRGNRDEKAVLEDLTRFVVAGLLAPDA